MVALLLAAAQEVDSKETLLGKLDPQRRAFVIAALLGLVLTGLFLMTLAWILARRFRRFAKQNPRPTREGLDAWARKPLVSQDDGLSDEDEMGPEASDSK